MANTHKTTPELQNRSIGVVGLGFMGRSISACLLGHGLRVIACESNPAQHQAAREHIATALQELIDRAGFDPTQIEDWPTRYTDRAKLEDLGSCEFVLETVTEDMEAKRAVFDQLEAVLGPQIIIASNTSATPISTLQLGRKHPERFIGMHWCPPVHIMRMIEIIRGEHTSDRVFEQAGALARAVGKQPSMVERDVPGFVANRLQYAMLREAFYMLETGVADKQTIDSAYRNSLGWLGGYAGPFRWLDISGIATYARVMERLLPDLCDSHDVPPTARRMVESQANGVESLQGFYEYDAESAHRWKHGLTEYMWAMKTISDQYLPLDQSEAEPPSEDESSV